VVCSELVVRRLGPPALPSPPSVTFTFPGEVYDPLVIRSAGSPRGLLELRFLVQDNLTDSPADLQVNRRR
jgi:hypothetical protein